MLRRFLASLVLWGFPVLCLAVVIVTGYLVVPWFTQDADLPWFVYLVLLPLSVAIVVGTVQALRTRPEPSPETELDRMRNPLLWEEVESIARAAGTEPPVRVLLETDVNASASIEDGRSTLRLGLPLLATLTVDQLRAVIAHELGHFRGGEARYLARTMRVTDALDRMIDAAGIFAALLLGLYRALYGAVAGGYSRQTELAADKVAAEVAGPGALAGALRQIARTAMVEPTVDELGSLFPAAKARARITEAYREVLSANANEIEADLAEYLAWETTTRGSSHPPIRARLEGLPAAEPAEGAWAMTLMGDPDAAERSVLARDWPLTEWDVVAAAAGVEAIRGDLQVYAWDSGEPTTLNGVLDEVDAGDFDPDEKYFLHSLVREALARDGRARAVGVEWTFGEAGPLTWEYDLPEVEETIAAAVEAKDTRVLRELLAGVDLTRPPQEPSGDQAMGSLTDLKSSDGPVDLHVSMQGLLLAPVDGRGPIDRLNAIRAYDAAVARRLPGVRWIPLAEIAKVLDGELALLAMDNKRITIRLRDGGKLSLRRTGKTTELPEDGSGTMALAELADQLG